MSETAEVRLVRCPKCENLLPEVTGYSVYRCGGCGAVLRAGDKGVDLDSFSERSDEEKVAMIKEKYLEKFEEKNTMSERRMVGQGDGMSSIISSSRAARRALQDSAENYGDSLMDGESMWDHGGGTIQGRDLDELGRASVARDFEDLTLYKDDENRMQRLDRVSEEHGSFNLLSMPSYDYEFKVKNRIGVDGFNKDGCDGEDQPKILRGLDGRNERLSRYGYLNDRGKGKTFLDRPTAYEDSRSSSEYWYPNKSSGVNSSSGQYPYLGTRFDRPSYQNQYSEPSLMHRLEMGGDGFNPSRYALNHVLEHEGPLRSQMLRRGPFRAPPPYQQPLSHPYSSGSYQGDGMVYLDPFEQYNPSDNHRHHHPSCSCFHCFNTRQVPHPVAFSDKFSDVSVDTMFNYHKNPGSFSPLDYNFQAINHHPLRSHNPVSHTRWPSDVNSEVNGFVRGHPARVDSASAVLHGRPIGGGAPFFVCFNCFELLLLPKNVATNNDHWKKIKCGACSMVIVFGFSNNKLVLCDDVEVTTDSPVKLDDNSNLSPIRGELYMHGHLNQVKTTFLSDDYDNTGYNFESMDGEPEQPSPGRGRGSDPSESKHQNSRSKHTIEVETVTESVNVLREDSKLACEETKNKEPPPVGSSLQEYFEYSNKFHVKNHQGSHEKYLPSKTSRQQSSVNDSSAATETDVSSNEFSNTGTSFDSGEASRKGRRASESFFAGIVKKSFKEFSRSNQNAEKEKADVTINGHRMPNEMIKKAEEVAGPIHPGQYWYDYRAGFWGLMGGPCLGIIPPGIEEFNHPMPKKCAGGNTGIYVNGRELEQKDLNLLKRRGMPTDRNRSYAIEISGRIIDRDTGEELKSLGKLAPTMERLQRGYGMRVPKGAPPS
ncbi:protein ENHANCED DISEASE RESISTANCE 4-like isoform X1 [Primulina eburnea]|uniref:protein ENHANCED DISEASE RESISTANCE 4-like isoform X1 n=1 Tax=Primulina eburnea TaxID=1245227 RepID=UPI003C6C2D83